MLLTYFSVSHSKNGSWTGDGRSSFFFQSAFNVNHLIHTLKLSRYGHEPYFVHLLLVRLLRFQIIPPFRLLRSLIIVFRFCLRLWLSGTTITMMSKKNNLSSTGSREITMGITLKPAKLLLYLAWGILVHSVTSRKPQGMSGLVFYFTMWSTAKFPLHVVSDIAKKGNPIKQKRANRDLFTRAFSTTRIFDQLACSLHRSTNWNQGCSKTSQQQTGERKTSYLYIKRKIPCLLVHIYYIIF